MTCVATGPTWTAVCAILGALWIVAASLRTRAGFVRSAVRGLLGGIGAIGAASGTFVLLHAFGVAVQWDRLSGDGWVGLATALLIGVVEESAKLVGIVLGLETRGSRDAYPMTVSVAAVFAVVEAWLAMRGASWPLAATRAVLAPVAHAAFAIPFGFVLSGAPGGAGPALTRLARALAVASALHGLGDLALAQGGWSRIGFAAAMLVPVLWLYGRERASTPPLRRAQGA